MLCVCVRTRCVAVVVIKKLEKGERKVDPPPPLLAKEMNGDLSQI